MAVRPEAPPSELAVAVARHFEQMDVDEEECIGGFLERLEKSSGATDYARKSSYFDGRAPQPAVRKRRRTKLAARANEQVRVIRIMLIPLLYTLSSDTTNHLWIYF